MNARVTVNRRLSAVVLAVIVVSYFVLAAPVGAVKIERSNSQQAQKDQKQPAPAKESGDTARTTTRSLLDDVESQKKTDARRDSLDTWIDRDGDGVNDKMKKPSTTKRQPVRERQPEPAETAQPKSEPKEQKQDQDQKSTNKPAPKERRR